MGFQVFSNRGKRQVYITGGAFKAATAGETIDIDFTAVGRRFHIAGGILYGDITGGGMEDAVSRTAQNLNIAAGSRDFPIPFSHIKTNIAAGGAGGNFAGIYLIYLNIAAVAYCSKL